MNTLLDRKPFTQDEKDAFNAQLSISRTEHCDSARELADMVANGQLVVTDKKYIEIASESATRIRTLDVLKAPFGVRPPLNVSSLSPVKAKLA